MCLYPREIDNPKYKPNKKNKGIVPPCTDIRLLTIMIPCGKCMECHKTKGRQWATRLIHEIKDDPGAVMVTLTFNTEHLATLTSIAMEKGYTWGYALDNAVAKLAVRRFYDRWRKAYGGRTLKHWLITELGKGEHEHMHLHGLVWTDHPKDIADTWGYGFVHIGKYVSQRTINYMMKYFLKLDDKHPNYKPIVLTSPGIGKGYIGSELAKFNGYNGKETKQFYVDRYGAKRTIPKYFRDKIYTEEQRERLRLDRMESPIKYIGGKSVNIVHNEQEYQRLYSAETQKNNRLGYKKSAQTTEKQIAENQVRGEVQKKRLAQLQKKSVT